MKLPSPPPLSGAALRALVAAAESPATGALVFATMTKRMGIDRVLAHDDGDEPLPLHTRPLVLERKR